ncbi:hypothetical protein C2845_PM02G02160 [Panicum miliaceum]|uniref:Uncharacterized protein n=1 Tax=Panicum miliaceum TaxID=4540 RepID=A0A3L6S9A0_PANMI|nr:hypothetical protein C2845_PM02G02160 [Panicum miliaceum]
MGTVGGRLPLEALRQVQVRLSLSLLARAAVGSSSGTRWPAQVRLLLLTVRKKVHLTTSSSSGMCGAWSGSGKEEWTDADAGCLTSAGSGSRRRKPSLLPTSDDVDARGCRFSRWSCCHFDPKTAIRILQRRQKLCSGSIAPGA